jgi:hypothetical protein
VSPSEGPAVYLPGGSWTARVSGGVLAGDPLEVTGSGVVGRAQAGAVAYVGIAAEDCPDGGQLTIICGSVILESVAGTDIDAGDLIIAGDAPGQVDSAAAARTRVYPGPAVAAGWAPDPVIYDPDVKVYPPPAVALGAAPAPAMYPRVYVYPPPAVADALALNPWFMAPAFAAATANAPRISVVALPALDRATGTAPDPLEVPRAEVFPRPAVTETAAPAAQGSAGAYPLTLPAVAAASAPDPAVAGVDVPVQLITPVRFSVTAVPAVTVTPAVPATVTPDLAETTAITGQATALASFPASAARAVTTAIAGQATVTGIAPTVTSCTPANGLPTTTQVTIRGTRFTADSVVEFGPAAGPRYQCGPPFVTVDSSTQIRCIPPNGPPNGTPATCWVTTPGGTGSLANAFRYDSAGNPLPTVTNVQPAAGGPGTYVTITGTTFYTTGQTAFDFGGFLADNPTGDTVNTGHCNAPAGPPPGPCDVRAITHAGTGPVMAGAFTYTAEVSAAEPANRAAPADDGEETPLADDGELALLGVALTTALAGGTVLWLARRPRYPWSAAPPPVPLTFELPPPPHGPVTGAHTHPHSSGWGGDHDHPHLHRGDDRHDEGPGHPHDLATDGG